MSFQHFENFIRIQEETMPNTNEQTSVCSICGNPSPYLKRGENGAKYCPECIQREQLIRCSHHDCNKYLKPDEILLSGTGYLCKDHWNSMYSFCHKCGVIIPRKYSYSSPDGDLCQHCFNESYFQCEDCGQVHPLEDKVLLDIDGHQLTICKTCRKTNYHECHNCHELRRLSNLIHIHYKKENGNRDALHCCDKCVSSLAHKCGSCGEWFDKNIQFHDESNCDQCYYQKGEIIHQYNYKPKIQPKKAAAENEDLLFGVELEIELKYGGNDEDHYSNRNWVVNTSSGSFNVDYKRYIAWKVDNAIPGFFYQKNDGSINFGMEIVSHPGTLEFWQSQHDKIEELFSFLRSEGCEGDNASSVGMHIHCTRNKMKRMHQNGFAAFVYSHKNNIEILAGRRSNSYTKMIPIKSDINLEDENQQKSLEDKIIGNGDRYSAVNWTNRHTVELRMFQSTLNTKHFLANIEFSHALYHFSKEHNIIECINDTSWKSFCDFIENREYKFLKEMMLEKSIFQIG